MGEILVNDISDKRLFSRKDEELAYPNLHVIG